jgi:hypothetical protein
VAQWHDSDNLARSGGTIPNRLNQVVLPDNLVKQDQYFPYFSIMAGVPSGFAQSPGKIGLRRISLSSSWTKQGLLPAFAVYLVSFIDS